MNGINTSHSDVQLNNAEYLTANALVEGQEMPQNVDAKAVDLGGIQAFPVIAKDCGMLKPNKLPGGFHGTQRIDESSWGDSFVSGRIASEEVS